MLELPLKRTFRYVHEPLRGEETAIPMLGNSALSGELRDRIVHSRGGTFLVTGFRGVGKSTVVLRALDALADGGDRSELVVPVVLSVARAADTDRLLFAVVRRIFESLNDQGLMARLPVETQRSLLLAYMRTSLAFKQTRSDSAERGGSAEAGGGTVFKSVVPRVSVSAKRTRSLATEAQFLAYSETDVEHDIMRIVSLLDRAGPIPAVHRGPLRRLWPWPRRIGSRIRLAVVLDEADKLTDGESGLAAVEALLGGIKNVLTMPGVHFLVVAGPDLHDRVLKDAARGNSVYESVFGWRMYVPCSWDAVELLLEGVIADAPEQGSKEFEEFRDYLRFKARGVPRRLLQEFHDFVVWRDGRPIVRVQIRDADRISFYARLEDILRKYLDSGAKNRLFPIPIDEDRRRLSAYYVIDWVLRSEGDSFRAVDLMKEGAEAEIDPMLRVSLRSVEALLDHLADQQILEIVRQPNARATLYGDVGEAQQIVYRLADDVMRAFMSLAARNETERAALEVSAAPAKPMATGMGTAPGPRILRGRYELIRQLGAGGMSSVWLARDRLLGRNVAVKMMASYLGGDDTLATRFRREGEIIMTLDHPSIVHAFDFIVEGDTVAIVMEFLEGQTLGRDVANSGPMSPAETVRIASVLATALVYLEEKGVMRIDLKPENVMVHPTRGPVIIDFGIARSAELASITAVGSSIGTPAYMAPEQVMGHEVDHRSDIYALGMIMYFCLTGRSDADSEHVANVLYRVLNLEVDLSVLPVSYELRQLIGKALRKNPSERYQHAADLLRDLERAPEASTVSEVPPLWGPRPVLPEGERRRTLPTTVVVIPPDEPS